jgi:hypothetical protein
MKHLSLETLARLVDEKPSGAEAKHLEACSRCRGELDALRGQTEGLAHLPDLRPPSRGWDELEARLREEGLVVSPGSPPLRRAGPFRGPWIQVAAALVLLLGGVAVGAALPGSTNGGSQDLARLLQGTSEGPAPGGDARMAALDPAAAFEGLSLEEAAELVSVTEEWHRAALLRYHELQEADTGIDPITRYAALEALMAAGQLAVREAPTDPFLNGLLLNMQAERDASLRGLQARLTSDGWY